jgi:hypothetical protein
MIMWEDPVVDELHRMREHHAKSLDYDFAKIFADWQKKQTESGRILVNKSGERKANNNA